MMALRCQCVSIAVVIVCLVFMAAGAEGYGCKHKCCKGRNNACRALGPRMNSPRSRVCFCDENCMEMRDCCLDYLKSCRPKKVNCQVGGWSAWGKCNAECGFGHQARTRPVTREAKHGGDVCPSLNEKRACFGNKCITQKKTAYAKEMKVWRTKHIFSPYDYPSLDDPRVTIPAEKESAKIIPAQFGTWRASKKYDPYRDIRKNLFYHYKSNEIIKRPPYCAKFELTKTRKSCGFEKEDWGRVLTMRGRTICVECQPSAMNKHLGDRCNGHGVFMKETRWNALNIPHCHGYWIMKSKHQQCTCNPNSDHSFILV